MKYQNKIQKFMIGRYGPDDLYYFLFKIYIILFISNLFIKSFFISYIELILIIIILYRFLSKKTYVRAKENALYIKLKKKVLKPFKSLKRNYKDRNEWIYKRCRHCKKLLKLPLPNKRGRKTIKCPKCKKESNLFTLKQQKIEIINNKK